MSVSGPDFSKYSTILFMDSMIGLEARPFRELPWQEIDPAGPILVLVVPQVNAEIDKRKRDGRVGKRAREFNRLITPAAETSLPSRIYEGPPQVDIAMAVCDRIDWDQLDDLDPDSGDARVVAQILNARDVPREKRLLFSHDINPIAMAARHELRSRKMPDHWLLEPEPSPNEKELQKLRLRVRELESEEPLIEVDVTFEAPSPLTLYDVSPLTPGEQQHLVDSILAKNPPRQRQRSLIDSPMYDYTYDDKYERFRAVLVPRHASKLHRRLETDYNQVPFILKIENKGPVQAENLIVSLTTTGGTLHDRFQAYPVFGPLAPQPKPTPFYNFIRPPKLRDPVGLHEMVLVDTKDDRAMEFNCRDFRQGRPYEFHGFTLIDVRAESSFKIAVLLTASNQTGQRTALFEQDFVVKKARPEELVNSESREHHIQIPTLKRYDEAMQKRNFKWLEFLGDDDEDDD
ncbi:MAG: hypothetical protein JWO19_6045 [Bryobacterales bacterium]|nr:hypothetical protein [Bryobacterales bacterium]